MRLSVVMANYNHGCYLKERISSLLEQMGPHDEFIIVDDASTDNSREIIKSFEDKRLVLLENAENQGVVKTCLRGTTAALGEFLFQIAADDKLQEGFIDTAMSAFQEHPEAALFCCDYGIFKDTIIPYPLLKGCEGLRYLTPDQTLSLFKKTDFRIPGHTVVTRRSLFFHYGAFDNLLGPYCDWFLWHAMALNEPLLYAPNMFVLVRADESNFSRRANTLFIRQALLLKLCENKPLKKQFTKGLLLYPFVRKNLMWGLKHPCLWDLFTYTIAKSLMKRWRKSVQKKIQLRRSGN